MERLYFVACMLTLLGVLNADGRTPSGPDEVDEVLAAAGRTSAARVWRAGMSAGGRPIEAVELGCDPQNAAWKVLLVGRQHGDEPAGGEALVELIRLISEGNRTIPDDTTVWVVPMVNPDGAAAGNRSNGAGADLNRDHIRLDQPETRALHRLARELRPHVVVDCHEFTRDSADYLERGWGEWPLITMDVSNHPLLPRGLYETGLRWLDRASQRMADRGFSFRRYLVGGVPPEEELRPSTLDGDDARNGLALDGSLGFIIESGILRRAENPNADLDRRVAAYLELLDLLVSDATLRAGTRAAVQAARRAPVPEFVPCNVFWANATGAISAIKVVDLATGRTRAVETPNLMRDRVTKRSVRAPMGYVIDRSAADLYRGLLERHAIPFETTTQEVVVRAEPVQLVRVESAWDPVYARYGGRQITQILPPAELELPTGSIVVRLDGPHWRRAVVLLEPAQLYGLYQYSDYRDQVSVQGVTPVARLINP